MEAKTPETLEDQNHGDNTLVQVSESSGLLGMAVSCTESMSIPEISVDDNVTTAYACDTDNGVGNVEVGNKDCGEGENLVENVDAVVDIKKRNGGFDRENEAYLCPVLSWSDEKLLCPSGNENPSIVIEKTAEEVDGVDSAIKEKVSENGISLSVDSSGLNHEAESFDFMETEEISEKTGDEKQVTDDDNKQHEFSVGDAVWVKTKSQTWWPGKIYALLNESKCLDSDTRDSLLLQIGYLGSSHVTRCSPSQLKPFHENFKQILGKNKSRGFLGAVEKAVDEFGRRVKLGMSCSCVQKGIHLPACDAKSKELPSRPENRAGELGEFSVSHFEPKTFLSLLKNLAAVVSVPGILELAAARNQLSAFYLWLGHCQLTVHLLQEASEAEDCSAEMLATKIKNIKEGSNPGSADVPSHKVLQQEMNGNPIKVLDGEIDIAGEKSSSIVTRERKISSRSKRKKNINEFDDLDGSDLVSSCKEEVNSQVTDEEGEGKAEKESESRARKKSKYLSYPYINLEQKSVLGETKDTNALDPLYDGMELNLNSGQVLESPLISKCNGQKFWQKWYRKFARGSNVSGNSELTNESSAKFLAELRVSAVDCLYPNENKEFYTSGWFFSKFRISVFHDETIYTDQNQDLAAESCLFGKNLHDKKISSPAVKTETKKRKRKEASRDSGAKSSRGTTNPAGADATSEMEVSRSKPDGAPDMNGNPESFINKESLDRETAGSGKQKSRSLSALSDVGINTSESSLKDAQDIGPLISSPKPKEKNRKKVAAAGVPDLNGSNSKFNLSVEDQHAASLVACQGKYEQKKKRVDASKHLNGTFELSDMNGSQKPGSFFIDLQVVAPFAVGDIPRQSDLEGKEGLASSLDVAGSSGNVASLAKDPEKIGLLSAEGNSGSKRRKTEGKAKTIFHVEMPDLNGTGIESNSAKEIQMSNGHLPQSKPKRKRRRKGEANLQQMRNEHVINGSCPSIALLLTFSPETPLPSKEVLITTFGKFGPLKETEIELVKDSSTAQIVFMEGTGAGEAVQSLERNNPFGATLVKYQLHRISAPSRVCQPDRNSCLKLATYPLGGYVSPSKLSEPRPPHPGEAPPLEFIRKNLQMMTSLLEKSGDNLSPEMRVKLEDEIQGLLKKVSSMDGSFSS